MARRAKTIRKNTKRTAVTPPDPTLDEPARGVHPAYAKLTDKQRVFVESYLVCWNAAEAARRAGYSSASAYSIGAENLTKPEIRAAIDARLKEFHLGADEVLARLSANARGSLAPFVRSQSGKIVVDLNTPDARAAMHLLKKVKVMEKSGGRGDHAWSQLETEIEIHDSQAANVHLGKYHRLFVEQHQVRTWRDEIIDLLRVGKITPEQVTSELGDDLATDLIITAGLRRDEGGETETADPH